MYKVLILGVNGFIGTHFQEYIVKYKLTEDYNFIGVDREIEKKGPLSYWEVDLNAPGVTETLIEDVSPDYIMNIAGVFE